MSEELTPLPTEAAGYLRGCNVELKEGDLLFTADQMLAYALENRLAPDARPEPAAPTETAPGWCKHCHQYTIEEPLQAAPTVVEPVGWLESPYGAFRASPLYRHDFPAQSMVWQIPVYDTPPRAPCDGGRCGVGGYCAKCQAVHPDPVEWRTFVYNGFVMFSIGSQTFRLAYAGDDALLPSQQAAQLEWMRTMLHAALSRLSATPPRAALTDAEWCAGWLLNHYQDHLTVASLCEHMLEAAHGIGGPHDE